MTTSPNPNTIVFDDNLTTLFATYLKQHITTPVNIDPAQLAYRWVGGATGTLQPLTVNTTLTLDDLLGIDSQKDKLIQNTEQFLAGYPANHVLITGTRGAGKSSLIRALLTTYQHTGLRMIEVARDDLRHLDKIRQAINTAQRQNAAQQQNEAQEDFSGHLDATNCRYIVYCDDLAFNRQDENYRTLKTVLDGALDSEQKNLLVYATSNRRHLLPQLMKDNVNIYDGQTDEINPYETIDETVSLSDRFGLWLSFHPMTQDDFLKITQHYIDQAAIPWRDTIRQQALQWASTRGGRSGRVAYQFAQHWIGQYKLAQTKR